MRRALAITLALFAVVYAVALIRYGPPPPAAVDAPAERFSATRAHEVHRRLVGDGATRFIGTEGNARGRAVIVAELEKLGWSVETQHATSCTFHGACAPVANVVATLSGREPLARDGVLVSAHYDSVLAGPGASDDGLGTVTLLETARALSAGPKPRRTIVALFTDGEEGGLLGAEAFVREHPLAAAVRTTVNVDARGSRGPSQMFETSRGNAGLVSLVAQNVERPVTTSLFYEVYKRMPNDTDFTVTKTIASGVNFANIAGIEHYHTPLDALGVSDLGTLQHHGEHVLAMTRAFSEAGSSGPAAASGDAVWFDVLAFGIVRWPERWSLLIALVALSLVTGRAIRAREGGLGLAALVALLPGVVAALVVGWLLRALGALPAPWIAHPLPALGAMHVAAGGAALVTALLLARRSTPRALWAGTWIGWGVLGVGTAAVAPGTSYLFVVPTLAAALTSAMPLVVACVVPAVVAAVLVLALATGIYDGLGFTVVPLAALPTLLLTTTIAPMLAGLPASLAKRAPIVLGAGTIALGLVAVVVPKFTTAVPQRVNVVFRQDDAEARAFVDTTWGPSTWGTAPASMSNALGSPLRSGSALPWTLPSTFVDTQPIDLKPPLVEVLGVEDDGQRHLARVRLRSQRGASTLAIVLPSERRVQVKVGGRFAHPRPGFGARSSISLVALFAVPNEGVVVELESTPTPIPFTLLDRTVGVPPGTRADDAVRARPPEATPFQDGDVTVVTTRSSI